MKKLLLLGVLLLVAYAGHARDLYSVTINVTSAYDEEPIVNVKVVLQLNKRKKFTYVAYTDSAGNASFDNLPRRNIAIVITGPNRDYLVMDTLFWHNRFRNNLSFEKQLYPNEKLERKLWLMEDSLYGSSESPINPNGIISSEMTWSENARYGLSDENASYYLFNNLKYPKKSYDDGDEGLAMVSFIVEKNGDISHIAIERGISPEIDAEIRRVLRAMPLWRPAKVNNTAVRSKCSIPIEFILYD